MTHTSIAFSQMVRIFLMITCLMLLLVPGALAAEQPAEADASRTLIVYYSKTGTTEAVVEHIAQATGGTVLELLPVEAYPEDYDATVERVRAEMADGDLPPLQNETIDVTQYDTIFLGSPIWFRDISRPLATFLSEYDLTGKTLVPFFTSGSSGQGASLDTIRELEPEAVLLESLDLTSNEDLAGDVQRWLTQIGLLVG